MNVFITICLVSCIWSISFALYHIKRYNDLKLSVNPEEKVNKIISEEKISETEITLQSIEESYLNGTLTDDEIEKLKDLNKIYESLIVKRNGFVSEILGKPKTSNTNNTNSNSKNQDRSEMFDDFDIENGIVGDFGE